MTANLVVPVAFAAGRAHHTEARPGSQCSRSRRAGDPFHCAIGHARMAEIDHSVDRAAEPRTARAREDAIVRRLGRLATRRRWWVIALALLLAPAAALLGGSAEEHRSAGGLNDPGAASSRAAALLEHD